MNSEFSYVSRQRALERFRTEIFDFLVVGGGITGAAVARDAASRGLRVALIEREDFASGTSSASSKLIHGGLRYLENLEFKLVFESLSERAHLVRTQPHLVRWLKFYLPVYRTDPRGMTLVSMGLWLYDLLSLFRAPHFHRRLSRERMLAEVPGLKSEGLVGGFTYYDASMWDDVMCVENAHAAQDLGAAVATRLEASAPIWAPIRTEPGSAARGRITGFRCIDRETGEKIDVHAKRTILCGGPYTDRLGEMLLTGAPEGDESEFREASASGKPGPWRHWLKPSRGTHLVLAKDRLPVKGAMLLTNPDDGRVSFVIPREDFGPGVVIVGTTDGPSPADPGEVRAEKEDVDYLLALLARYFPALRIGATDILSTYVGVRPLMDPEFGQEPGESGAAGLATVSREHHIGRGPGGTILVAGGKYTTHRTMAEEIVDCALAEWTEDYWKEIAPRVARYLRPRTMENMNPAVTRGALADFRGEFRGAGLVAGRGLGLKLTDQSIEDLIERYGAEARSVLEIAAVHPETLASPEGFPYLEAQLRYAIRKEMVLHLDDFYFRRLPLYLGRKDHAEGWIETLARVWASELGKTDAERTSEITDLRAKIARRNEGFH